MIAHSPTNLETNFHANIEAEEEILGAILDNDRAIELAVNSLPIEAFSLVQHQIIFNACIRCYKANKTTNLMAVAVWLRDNNQLDNIGGQAKLAQLVDRTSGIARTPTAIEIVLREYWRRKLNSLTSQIQGLTSDRSQKIEEIIGKAESEILNFNAAFSRSSTSFYRTKIKLDGDLKESVESLLEASNDTLEIAEIYPYGGLGNALVQKARNLPIAPECLHQTLIGVCAGILGTRARVEVHKGWTEPAVIFSGFVGEPGSKKSPAVSSILKPLVELQEKDFLEFQNNELSYQIETIEWDALKKDEKAERLHNGEIPPEKPLMRHRYVRNLTVETVLALHAEKPSSVGFPAVYDELAEFFLQLNQYKGGKGSDRQVVLQWWNASDIKVDRKSKDSSVFMGKSAISITGAIQYSVLAQLMGDKEDGDGMWGRFLWSCPKYIRADRRSRSFVDISGILTTLYKKLDSFPEMTYKLSPDAYDLLIWYESQIEDRRETASTALRNTYAKLIGYTARLALVLHCIDMAMGKEAPFDIVDVDTMARAISLCLYYEGQSRWLHAQILGSTGEISTELARIISEYQDKGEVDSSALRNRKFGNASQCKEWLRELAVLGYGQVIPAGKGKLKFTFFSPEKTRKQEDDENHNAKGSNPYPASVVGDDEKISRFHEENIFNEESTSQPLALDVPVTAATGTQEETILNSQPEENLEPSPESENLPVLAETPTEQETQASDEALVNFSVGDRVIINSPNEKSHLRFGTVTEVTHCLASVRVDGSEGSLTYRKAELIAVPAPIYGDGNPAKQGDKVKDSTRTGINKGENLGMDYLRRGTRDKPFWQWKVKVRWADGQESNESIEFLELDNGDDNGGNQPTTEPDDGGNAIVVSPEHLAELRQFATQISTNYAKYSEVATSIEENAPLSDGSAGMIISFSETIEGIRTKQKAVTRRDWSDDYAARWLRAWDEGRHTHQAWSALPHRGGEFLAKIKLTEKPYQELLSDMPDEDVALECVPDVETKEQFIEFLGGDRKVWVIRFCVLGDELVESAIASDSGKNFQPGTDDWKVDGFKKGDIVRRRLRDPFLPDSHGKKHIKATLLTYEHGIQGELCFYAQIGEERQLIFASEIEVDQPLAFGYKFGERLKHKKTGESGYLTILGKNRQACVKGDSGNSIFGAIKDFDRIPPEKDTEKFRAAHLYSQIRKRTDTEKGSLIKLKKHDDHKGFIGKVAEVTAKKIDVDGNYRASVETDKGTCIVNLAYCSLV